LPDFFYKKGRLLSSAPFLFSHRYIYIKIVKIPSL
jgi:hypothetical protein